MINAVNLHLLLATLEIEYGTDNDRHGWGCQPSPEKAVRYLTAAASNAASVEQLALQAGLKKGGAAKGELVLAIFELANCFRNGWGIDKDPIAAKQYYETAANLGDTGMSCLVSIFFSIPSLGLPCVVYHVI